MKYMINLNMSQANTRESGAERERIKKVMAKMDVPDKGVFFAVNRDNKTATLLAGFSCFEEIQGTFRCGILMPDGSTANGIGRCASNEDFVAKAKHGNWTIL